MIVPGVMQVLQTLGKSVKRGGVPLQTLDLVHLHASQINGCSVCANMHSRELKQAKHMSASSQWRRDEPYFTEAERAALALPRPSPDSAIRRTWYQT